MNPQEKYFGILHTSKKTSYSEQNTLVFSKLKNLFAPKDFDEVEKLAKNNLLGYFSYDMKNSLENLPVDASFFIDTPACWFGEFEKVETHSNYKLPTTKYQAPGTQYLKSNMTKSEYISKVQAIRKYIESGDIYQANLTRKFYGEFSESVDPFNIYCELNRISPAPYSAYLKLDDLHIISSSPELFIRVDEKGNAVTCPIKGSMGKGRGIALTLSEKNRSENLMITDLMRNDFSRACKPSSVKVEKLFEVDEFETISHMHSTITGTLADDLSSVDLIKGCFPPGSMTGAPKIRAMEICSELERHKRGIYSGALGYFKPDGSCEFSVVIRTIIIKGNKFEFQVGGGIVYDSEPEDEWNETMIKAQAIAEVLGTRENILQL